MSATQSPLAVCIHGLVVEAGGRAVLQLPCLTVRPGERIALLGPNGAGKSTLLRVLTGTLRPARGEVQVLGRQIAGAELPPLAGKDLRALRAQVGQVIQGMPLVPRLSALENTLVGALARRGELPAWRSWTRLYPAPLVAEARAVLAQLGVAARAEVRADRLSGGERQKVAIARALMQRPRLLLADEPTSALDPNSTEAALRMLQRACTGATLITVVHQAALLPALADRVLGLAGGQLVFDLPCGEVNAQRLDELYRTTASPQDRLREHGSDLPAWRAAPA